MTFARGQRLPCGERGTHFPHSSENATFASYTAFGWSFDTNTGRTREREGKSKRLEKKDRQSTDHAAIVPSLLSFALLSVAAYVHRNRPVRGDERTGTGVVVLSSEVYRG